MSSKTVLGVLLVSVLMLSGWEVYRLVERGGSGLEEDPEVLAATTTRTLEERVASLESRVLVLERNVGLVKPKTAATKKEQYVQLSGGSVTASEWAKIDGTEFSFDALLYGGSVEVSWQGWVDNGYGSVRIYDDTNHRAVDGSEISVNSGVKSSFYSKSMSIWRGQNQYFIQGKNPLGVITVSQPRLRIVTR